MLKKLGIVIPSAVLTLLMAVGFSTPAFAYVELEVKEEPAQVIEEEEPTEEEKIPFTIAGNGKVEDNITDDSSKEFFTVKTKGGKYLFSSDRPGKEQRECVYALHDRRIRFAGVSDR